MIRSFQMDDIRELLVEFESLVAMLDRTAQTVMNRLMMWVLYGKRQKLATAVGVPTGWLEMSRSPKHVPLLSSLQD